MQRKILWRSVLIVIFLIAAIFTLYPTFSVAPTQKEVARLSNEISQISGKSTEVVQNVICGDIQPGVKSSTDDLSREERRNRLETDLRSRLRKQLGIADQGQIEKILPTAIALRENYQTYLKHEGKAIKLGLDLQGGTFLVSEVNVPKHIYNLAKDKEIFDPIYQEALTEYLTVKGDFLNLLTEKIQQHNYSLRRFYGDLLEGAASEGEIKEEIDKEVKDAVNRTLEILRNRIDQFGVSEPNIQKQGDHRIIIELAGIKDIKRARSIIGTTAELRFQVSESNKALEDILNKINRTLREDTSLSSDTTAQAAAVTTPDTTQADTSAQNAQVAKDEKVQLTDLFKKGKGDAGDSTKTDTASAIVDKNTYKQAPFTSLLRIFSGRENDVIGVAPENKAAVDWILSQPNVKNITKDVEFLWGMETETIAEEQWYRLYLVRKNVELTGNYITNATVDLGGGSETQGRTGEAEVSMTLNREGAKIFSQLTERIINQKLAIILDGKVSSDPVVRTKIPNGRASIENIGTLDEAKDLALVLRAGALPAPMEFLEERTVGPSLGQDSVSKGTTAAIIGLISVMLFMAVYYSYFGVVADLALMLNILFLMAMLSGFGLTLTLPGVAGVVLTMGMAVDANVLIFERMREEARGGKTLRTAIENGYDRAWITILDSNVTTLITALVLFQFGTGPVKGFAVTLFWGITISMFTAIIVTRVIFDYMTSKNWIKRIPF